MQLSIYGTGNDYLTLLNTNFETDGYLDIVDILCPKLKEDAQSEDDYEPFNKMESFNNFNVKSNQWIDYSRLMKVCPNVSVLSGFLNCDLSKSKIDGMLKDCKNLTYIDSSFNHTGSQDFLEGNSSHAIDLYDFFNWGDPEHPENSLFEKMRNLFTSSSSGSTITVGFSVKKEISNEHFLEIMGLLHNYQSISRLSNLFSYCTIKGYDGTEIKLDGDMNEVRNINSLFYKCKTNNGTPLKIRRSFFEHLKNVTLMANTFYGVWFDHMLSYDFFCKQIPENETSVDRVYLDPNGQTEATLKTVKYRNDRINDMSNCFCKAKFVSCDCWFNPDDEVNSGLVPFNDVVNDDTSITEYYKQEGGLFVKYVISENSARSDTRNNFTNYVPSVRILGMSETWQINNHDINRDLIIFHNDVVSSGPYTQNAYNIYPVYCCLPPDIFYGCNIDCNLENVFADTNIIGVIPQHLLKKTYNAILKNMLMNTNILPNLIYHYNSKTIDAGYLSLINDIPIDNDTITHRINEDDTAVYTLDGSEDNDAVVLFRNKDGELRRRYPIVNDEYNKSQFAYVPQGYTTNSNLNYAFTFRYNLPAQIDLEHAALAAEGINWSAGNYDTGRSPEARPDLWPYHTQYFLMSDESISWNRLIYMSYPFISDEQDIDLSTEEIRKFSSSDQDYKNKWWSNFELVSPSRWDSQTYGLLNVFLNLCGKRHARTGKVSDYGCSISKSMNNNPQLSSFISGILVVFLNGKVFDDGMDAGRFTALNASSNIIQYTLGFGRNITLPQINYTMADVTLHPRVLLLFNADNTLFYEYMFINNSSMLNYNRIFTNLKPENIKTGNLKYTVR
jgi:hypothetical protein